MCYRNFVGMNWFFIVVLNKGNKIENIICIMITLSFFNKLLPLYFYAIYCECNSFIFRIVQDERKQIAFKSEEHSIFYYLFRVFSLKYHKIQIKKKDIKERCSVFCGRLRPITVVSMWCILEILLFEQALRLTLH